MYLLLPNNENNITDPSFPIFEVTIRRLKAKSKVCDNNLLIQIIGIKFLLQFQSSFDKSCPKTLNEQLNE